MKRFYTLLFLTVYSFVNAQNINQFDTNGKRHGKWKKNFEGTDIVRYEGEFFHGKEIGLFKFYKNINKRAVLTATKQFNKQDNTAYVTFLSSRGKVISEGKMNGKKYVGQWKYYQKRNDNLLILEHYNANGILEGERFVYYKNGQTAEKQEYKSGKLDGISIWYTENGSVLKTFTYADGTLHGVSKLYDAKGQLIAEGQYKTGKKDGVWKYYENGKLTREKDFTYKPKYIKNKQ